MFKTQFRTYSRQKFKSRKKKKNKRKTSRNFANEIPPLWQEDIFNTDDSLKSDIWKDSFDKFVGSKTPLREENIVKKAVRVSFNLDSSVETSPNCSKVPLQKPELQRRPSKSKNLPFRGHRPFKNFISTPIRHSANNSLMCCVSPINQRREFLLQDFKNPSIQECDETVFTVVPESAYQSLLKINSENSLIEWDYKQHENPEQRKSLKIRDSLSNSKGQEIPTFGLGRSYASIKNISHRVNNEKVCKSPTTLGIATSVNSEGDLVSLPVDENLQQKKDDSFDPNVYRPPRKEFVSLLNSTLINNSFKKTVHDGITKVQQDATKQIVNNIVKKKPPIDNSVNDNVSKNENHSVDGSKRIKKKHTSNLTAKSHSRLNKNVSETVIKRPGNVENNEIHQIDPQSTILSSQRLEQINVLCSKGIDSTENNINLNKKNDLNLDKKDHIKDRRGVKRKQENINKYKDSFEITKKQKTNDVIGINDSFRILRNRTVKKNPIRKSNEVEKQALEVQNENSKNKNDKHVEDYTGEMTVDLLRELPESKNSLRALYREKKAKVLEINEIYDDEIEPPPSRNIFGRKNPSNHHVNRVSFQEDDVFTERLIEFIDEYVRKKEKTSKIVKPNPRNERARKNKYINKESEKQLHTKMKSSQNEEESIPNFIDDVNLFETNDCAPTTDNVEITTEKGNFGNILNDANTKNLCRNLNKRLKRLQTFCTESSLGSTISNPPPAYNTISNTKSPRITSPFRNLDSYNQNVFNLDSSLESHLNHDTIVNESNKSDDFELDEHVDETESPISNERSSCNHENIDKENNHTNVDHILENINKNNFALENDSTSIIIHSNYAKPENILTKEVCKDLELNSNTEKEQFSNNIENILPNTSEHRNSLVKDSMMKYNLKRLVVRLKRLHLHDIREDQIENATENTERNREGNVNGASENINRANIALENDSTSNNLSKMCTLQELGYDYINANDEVIGPMYESKIKEQNEIISVSNENIPNAPNTKQKSSIDSMLNQCDVQSSILLINNKFRDGKVNRSNNYNNPKEIPTKEVSKNLPMNSNTEDGEFLNNVENILGITTEHKNSVENSTKTSYLTKKYPLRSSKRLRMLNMIKSQNKNTQKNTERNSEDGSSLHIDASGSKFTCKEGIQHHMNENDETMPCRDSKDQDRNDECRPYSIDGSNINENEKASMSIATQITLQCSNEQYATEISSNDSMPNHSDAHSTELIISSELTNNDRLIHSNKNSKSIDALVQEVPKNMTINSSKNSLSISKKLDDTIDKDVFLNTIAEKTANIIVGRHRIDKTIDKPKSIAENPSKNYSSSKSSLLQNSVRNIKSISNFEADTNSLIISENVHENMECSDTSKNMNALRLRSGKWRRKVSLFRGSSFMSESSEKRNSVLTTSRISSFHSNVENISNNKRRTVSKIFDLGELEEENDAENPFLLEPTDEESPNLPASALLDNSSLGKNLQSSLSYIETVADIDIQRTTLPEHNSQFNESSNDRRHTYQQQLSTPLYQRQTSVLPARRRRTSVVENLQNSRNNPFPQLVYLPIETGIIHPHQQISTRDIVLRRCGQAEPLEFSALYSEANLHHCHKIGEGVFGEVFMNKTKRGETVVLKIIPIEGSIEINGEPQKKFDEILSEIIIAMELSKLRNDKSLMTCGFVEVKNVRCVQGPYPEHFIDLWELYRDNYGTENDHPEVFPHDQLFIVLELANGGKDLEAFTFQNALQSYSAFVQTAVTLAIAEQKFQFEHRDLHWGNILVTPTDEEEITFCLSGREIKIPTHGVKVTIIDYTLSRMIFDGCCLYNDLSNDEELFSATGDYQFDIYRFMKEHLGNNWEEYEPYTNILWLHYTIDKMINGVRYQYSKSKKHRSVINDMMQLRDELLEFKSASDYVESLS